MQAGLIFIFFSYDVYMFGGFDDEKRLSNKLSQSLLG